MLQVPEHAMTQHGGKALTIHRLIGVLAVGSTSVTRRWTSPGSRWSRCRALSSIADDGSSNVTS